MKSMDTPARPGAHLVWIWMMMTALPLIVTLSTVRHPGKLVYDNSNPTPLGYTWSLLLFVIPDLVMMTYLLIHPSQRQERRQAFLWSVALVFGVGCLLDFGFAFAFFTFPNRDAVLGLRLPAWNLHTLSWEPAYLPIEEFGFYLFGGYYMLSVYVWCDHFWVPYSERPPYLESLKKLRRFHGGSVLVGLLLIGAAWLFKNSRWSADPGGVPGYFIFEVFIALIPSMYLFHAVRERINWPAFQMMLLSLLLVSLMWEAMLGVPYGWWNYKEEMMMGIRIRPWSELPLESVLLWIASGWATVIAYETLRIMAATGPLFWKVVLRRPLPDIAEEPVPVLKPQP